MSLLREGKEGEEEKIHNDAWDRKRPAGGHSCSCPLCNECCCMSLAD